MAASTSERKIIENVETIKETLDLASHDSKESNDDDDKAQRTSLLEQNGFQVIRKIGTGSYSKVKLAYSESHRAMVAIKTVSKYHVPAEFLRKFLHNEVEVVRFLRHENIIKYYQSIETSHRLYVIMQHAENGSILDLIHKQKRLPEPRACHLIRQLLSAVEYCHSQGVAHRDIKCENVLLDDKFNVKLIDFGFAKCVNRPTRRVTNEQKLETIFSEKASFVRRQRKEGNLSETYCGSYAYASPEILKGTPYDPFMSDVWATGCVLYAMVFGRLPFDDRDPAKLIRQVQMPLSFSTKIPASEEVRMCLRKMLAPIKVRATIEKLWEDQWISSAHLKYNAGETISSRDLYTR